MRCNIVSKWVQNPIGSDITHDIASIFAWCGYNIKLYKEPMEQCRFRLVWLDYHLKMSLSEF